MKEIIKKQMTKFSFANQMARVKGIFFFLSPAFKICICINGMFRNTITLQT